MLTIVVAVAGTFLAKRVVVDSLGNRFDAQLETAAGVTICIHPESHLVNACDLKEVHYLPSLFSSRLLRSVR